MRDLATDELVAVKLIPRPIPRAIIPEHVFREIKVRTKVSCGLGMHCLNGSSHLHTPLIPSVTLGQPSNEMYLQSNFLIWPFEEKIHL